ncbi:MAG: DNA polymerase III subunit beta [Lachnospiraceae bacterium]|nr:DNA polymerase III subunit beta [Lachnospiraceae bacterium]
MKITLKKLDLFAAINTAGRAVSVKTTMPILQCLLINADDNGVSITANDMELAIETKISAEKCSVLENGTIAVEAKLFSDIIRKISFEDAADVTITSDGTLVEITSESSLFRIQEKDPEQFPELPQMREGHRLTVSQFTLKEVIKNTIFSIAANDSNKMMTGELFEVRGNNLRVIALDGHRIAIVNTELREEYESVNAIIPGKTLSDISKIIEGSADRDVEICFDDNYVSFSFDDTIMVSRLIDGDFFKIDSMLSNDYLTKITVNKRELLNSVERSSILISESDKKPLIFKLEDDSLNLRVNSPTGYLDDVLRVEKGGKDIMIAFNPKFLLDALRAIDDEKVDLYMTTSKAPCFIRDENKKYIYLILPVNFNPSAY